MFAGISFVLMYARKIKLNPQRSSVYGEDDYWRSKGRSDIENLTGKATLSAWISYLMLLSGLVLFSVFHPLTTFRLGDPDAGAALTLPVVPVFTGLFALAAGLSLRKSVQFYLLSLLGFTILFLIIGVTGYRWYIMKMAALFFALGIFSGVAMNYSPNRITALFLEGVKDILPAALIVGLAGGIIVILEDGKIIDSILHSLSSSMEGLGRISSVAIMYAVQTLINIMIPSGSAQAALTMPIMAPFSDLVGISRQAAVMVYQFGDGFTNMITPTSGVLIAVLGVARIPYEKWVRWIIPFMILLLILGFLLLIPPVTMELNGF
jgi:uncharacterized ion transporter superfamily protein YfcC